MMYLLRSFVALAGVGLCSVAMATELKSSSMERNIYATDLVTFPGGRLLVVLRAVDDKKMCSSIDDSATTQGSAEYTGEIIISQAYLTQDQKYGSYYYWVVEKSGVHITYLSSFVQKGCVLTEMKRNVSYFSGSARWSEAAKVYNALLAEALTGKR